ncbi:YueH family protein [Staphylococcus hominis]|nr:YueH family protein [Staphylococcus hominis]MCC3736380.1 YueH family protein [Staphylococcus hominis]
MENPTMIIKQLSEQNEIINVYLYEHVHHSYYMIAIPDMFWSVELNAQLNEQEINEELIMQLFTFKEESEALRIASQLSKWIIKDLKENNE